MWGGGCGLTSGSPGRTRLGAWTPTTYEKMLLGAEIKVLGERPPTLEEELARRTSPFSAVAHLPIGSWLTSSPPEGVAQPGRGHTPGENVTQRTCLLGFNCWEVNRLGSGIPGWRSLLDTR